MAATSLAGYINAGSPELVLRLVKARVEVTPSTVLADFPPADFDGAADVTPPPMGPAVLQEDGRYRSESRVMNFVHGPGANNCNVHGWVLFISWVYGDIRVAHEFFNTPIPMDAPGKRLDFGIVLDIEPVPETI